MNHFGRLSEAIAISTIIIHFFSIAVAKDTSNPLVVINSEVIQSLLDGSYDPANFNKPVRYAIRGGFSGYVKYFNEYCFQSKPDGLSDVETTQLQLEEARASEFVLSVEFKNIFGTTIEERERFPLKSKFGKLFVGYQNGDFRNNFDMPNLRLSEDTKAVIRHYRCVGPELELFEDTLVRAMENSSQDFDLTR